MDHEGMKDRAEDFFLGPKRDRRLKDRAIAFLRGSVMLLELGKRREAIAMLKAAQMTTGDYYRSGKR